MQIKELKEGTDKFSKLRNIIKNLNFIIFFYISMALKFHLLNLIMVIFEFLIHFLKKKI